MDCASVSSPPARRAAALAAVLLLPGAVRSAAPASAPTTRPGANRRRWKLSKELQETWRDYCQAWAGRNIEMQALTDNKLLQAIEQRNVYEIATLRDEMIRQYQRAAAREPREDFHCGRLASRIALAWRRMPPALTALSQYQGKKRSAEEVARWAVRALEHFVGDVSPHTIERYKVFLPAASATMLSLVASRGKLIDEPGAAAKRLAPFRARLLSMARGDATHAASLRAQIAAHYDAMRGFPRLQADKQAVRKLLAAFRKAYNARDAKAFAALFPTGHPVALRLRTRTLEQTLEPAHWQLLRWEAVYIVVKQDAATAYLLTQYRTKAGELRPPGLQGITAKRTDEGWKLN
jgi:hypothetical protein